MIITYAQEWRNCGCFKIYNYEINLEQVAKIWRGGCIIRSASLEDFKIAFAKNPELPNLILDEEIGKTLQERQNDLRWLIKLSADKGILLHPLWLPSLILMRTRSANCPPILSRHKGITLERTNMNVLTRRELFIPSGINFILFKRFSNEQR